MLCPLRCNCVLEAGGIRVHSSPCVASICESTPVMTSSFQEQILERGYCILRQHFDASAVAACAEAFERVAEKHLAENADSPNRGAEPALHPNPVRFPPLQPSFFDDDEIHAIVAGILGDEMVIDQFAADTPFKGSDHQEVHADLGLLFHEEPKLRHPPALLAMNWPLIDVTREHGPFEIAEVTHRLPREETLEKVKAGEILLTPLLMNASDVLIRDPRCLHRGGSPNRTDTPRVVAVVSYMRLWYHRARTETYPVPRSVFDGLSVREKRIMRHLTIDESQ